MLYATGQGVEKDLEQAYEYEKIACDHSVADGCLLIATMYEDGLGRLKNRSKALHYYKSACDLGSDEGCMSYKKLKDKN